MTEPIDESHLIYVHGFEGNAQGFKARYLRSLFPNMVIPDFEGDQAAWLDRLEATIGTDGAQWIIIGSSFGGLIATLFATEHPNQVKKLVLLAPALPSKMHVQVPLSFPVVLIHGTGDDVVPPAAVKRVADKLFSRLEYRLVDDDHRLQKTTVALDWIDILHDEVAV